MRLSLADQIDRTIVPANRRSQLARDLVEDGRGIGDRTADRGQDFAGSALLLIERLLGLVEERARSGLAITA